MKSADRQAPMRGALAALVCYLSWGLFPLYWRLLATVDATELIAHRLFWTMLFTVPLLWWCKGFDPVYAVFSSARLLSQYALSGVLLTINWLVFVWAINNGHVIETSLGYFLVPLVNVALGWGILQERLSKTQWVAISFATAGVTWQLIQLGRLPWIALSLAITFGAYGLLRKQSSLGSLAGLTVETLLLAPFAGAYLLWRAMAETGALGSAPVSIQLIVLSTGVVTAIPLLLFAYGAQRLRLTTMGLLQYAAPTVQFALGVWYYHEVFDPARAQSFTLIWVGLIIYTGEALWSQRRGNHLGVIETN